MSTQPTGRKVKFWEKLLVGGSAGVLACCIVYPLDVVKTRLQRSVGGNKGFVQTFTGIIREEGAGGLYRGILANLIGVFPVQAVKLASNDLFRELLSDKDGNVGLVRGITAGAGAGAVQVIASNPMEITKIRLQIQSSLPKEQRTGLIGVARELGLRGVYKGSTITLLRDVPYFMIFFPLNQFVVDRFATGGKTPGLGAFLTGGCIAGMTSAFCMTPMDVVKTRVQAAKGSKMEASFFTMFKQIFREEGIRALYKGAVPRMCVQAPQFAIMMTAFEFQKRFIAYGTLFPKNV